MKQVNEIKSIKAEYINFIKQFKWNVFMTLTPYQQKTESGNEKFIRTFLERNRKLIDGFFYVVERFKNYCDAHIHILIRTKNPKKLRRQNINIRKDWDCDFQDTDNGFIIQGGRTLPIEEYVCKFIGKDVLYDMEVPLEAV